MAKSKEAEPVFHEGAQCYVVALRYDFVERRGRLIMGDDSCTDMSGAIRMFEAIDPGVQSIATFAGATPDTSYVRVNGKWEALLPA